MNFQIFGFRRFFCRGIQNVLEKGGLNFNVSKQKIICRATKQPWFFVLFFTEFITSEKQYYAGITTWRYKCRAVTKERKLEFELLLIPENCSWKMVVDSAYCYLAVGEKKVVYTAGSSVVDSMEFDIETLKEVEETEEEKTSGETIEEERDSTESE